MENTPEMPENFPSVIRDFLADLSTTFPEYIYLWQSEYDMQELYKYCLSVYPERFFDILYQNDEIFLKDSEINTVFLPNVDFKLLYSTPDISDNTKEAIWKYLQLILVTIMGNIQSSASFGDAASLFEGINEEDLQSKLAETVSGLSDFFKGLSKEEGFDNPFETEATTEGETEENEDFMPNVDDLNDHIKGLFDGKIGSLAKELAEELSGDVMNMFDDGSVNSTGDILKKMMKNPKQIMELVKKIGSKLDDKMKSGKISQEEIMKEAGDLMSKMKGMGGNGREFKDMMQNMMKTMGLGKDAKMDMGKMTAMLNKNASKDRLRAKLNQRKEQSFVLEKSNNPNEMVFKLPEEGSQQKSQIPPNDDWLDEIPAAAPVAKKSKKGKKGNKGK